MSRDLNDIPGPAIRHDARDDVLRDAEDDAAQSARVKPVGRHVWMHVIC